MIKAFLVDDEINALSSLIDLIKTHCPSVSILGTAQKVPEAHKRILELQPDLVFLDIEMPHENGFNLLERFERPPFAVVFTTAYDDYAIKAIRFSALDYLLKPIEKQELIEAVERVERERNYTQSQFQQLNQNLNHGHFDTLTLKDRDGIHIVKLSDIVRFQSERNYTWVHLSDGSKQLMVKTLKHYDDLLSEHGFFRIHRSHLIHRSFVQRIDKSQGGRVILNDGTALPISERRKKAFYCLYD